MRALTGLLGGVLALSAIAASAGAALSAWTRETARSAPAQISHDLAPKALSAQLTFDRLCLAAKPCEPGQLSDAADAIWAHAPASNRPLIYAAYRAARAQDPPKAASLAEAVLARDPRNVLAHALVADSALQTGDLATALFHLERLIVLSPEQSEAFADTLAGLAGTKQGLDLLDQRLAERPAWGPGVLARLNASSADFGTLLRLNQHTPETQSAFVERVLRERGPQQALIAWLSFLPADEAKSLAWPYDPTFQSLPAPTPFNWARDRELVTFETGGGLFATYFGRGASTLAWQVMVLKPGAYRLETMASAEGEDAGGQISWVLSCYPNGPELARLPLPGNQPQAKLLATEGVVPAKRECSAQVLALKGEPGEFPIRARAHIASITITTPNATRGAGQGAAHSAGAQSRAGMPGVATPKAAPP